MKNYFKVFLIAFIVFSVYSCENQDMELLTIDENSKAVITAPEEGFTFILNPEEVSTNPALTMTWDAADYEVPTAISYVVQFSTPDDNFAHPIVAAQTKYKYQTWTISELNGLAVTTGLSPFVSNELKIRVASYVGTINALPQYSDAISIFLTPYTTELPKLAVPGNHQGWDPPTAPLLASAGFGQTNYEGYVYLDGGYKFVAPNATGGFFWGNTDYGDDGSNSGVLVETGESDCSATAGYYFVKANTSTLTYSTTAVSWGIIGAATPTGWDSDTDLTYDPTTRKLYVDINLVPGAFKFRGNNNWGAFDLGTVDAEGHLQFGGDLTFDGTAGNYRVVLDLSNPRKYTYTITPN